MEHKLKIKNRLHKVLGYLPINDKRSKIIFYHDLHSEKKYTNMSTDIKLFIEHINCIKKLNFEIVEEITQNYNQVKIQFDDGFKGIYENKDILISHKITPTIFIITSRINQKNYLTVNEIKELKSYGFIFQSHTHSHRNLDCLNQDEIQKEIISSKAIIEPIIGETIKSLCFPRGRFTFSALRVCKQHNLKEVYCSIPGNFKITDFLKKRYLVQTADIKEITNILYGKINFFQWYYFLKHFRLKLK